MKFSKSEKWRKWKQKALDNMKGDKYWQKGEMSKEKYRKMEGEIYNSRLKGLKKLIHNLLCEKPKSHRRKKF